MKHQINGFNDKDVIKQLATSSGFRSCDVKKINKKQSKFLEPIRTRNYKFISGEWRQNTWTKNDMCKCNYCDYQSTQYFMKWHHRSTRKLGYILPENQALIRKVPLCIYAGHTITYE